MIHYTWITYINTAWSNLFAFSEQSKCLLKMTYPSLFLLHILPLLLSLNKWVSFSVKSLKERELLHNFLILLQCTVIEGLSLPTFLHRNQSHSFPWIRRVIIIKLLEFVVVPFKERSLGSFIKEFLVFGSGRMGWGTIGKVSLLDFAVGLREFGLLFTYVRLEFEVFILVGFNSRF